MRVVLAVAVSAVLLLCACPPTGVVCRAGTLPCGAGCIDPDADQRNCGACGSTCGASQVCAQGACQCQPGTTSCNGECVVLAANSLNCGACGAACDGGVCEAGTCQVSCTAGVNVPCNGACVDVATDDRNCGACGTACSQGQSCRTGFCAYDLVAACFSTGQAVRFNGTTFARGPLADLGSNPAALAAVSSGGAVAVLAADGTDRTLYQATVGPSGVEQASRANRIGAAANQVVVDGQRVYVVNAESGTLQVLLRGKEGPDVLTFDAGVAPVVALGTVDGGELNFGLNTYPEGVAVAGGFLWVPLYGGAGAGPAAAGQAVAKVALSSAGVPTVVGRVDLKTLDLRTVDGGTTVARPWTVVAHRGAVYVVLNNLNPDTWAPQGPGLLARIEPGTSIASVVGLGTGCLNPQWAAEVGERLAVSCGGQATYDLSTYAVTGLTKAGLALLDGQDQLQDFWPAPMPTDGGAAFFPGRFAVVGGRLFLGDQNAGRVVVLDASDAGLAVARGVDTAVSLCPLGSFGVANVSDLVALPRP